MEYYQYKHQLIKCILCDMKEGALNKMSSDEISEGLKNNEKFIRACYEEDMTISFVIKGLTL